VFKIKRTDRIGETKINKWDNIMTIVEYINSHDINVEFESGYETKTTYDYFKKGNIKSPYYKSVLNKGFIGEGQYQVMEFILKNILIGSICLIDVMMKRYIL